MTKLKLPKVSPRSKIDDERLDKLIQKSLEREMTPEEKFEQRVSFVYGMLPEENTLTKNEVRQHLKEHYGKDD